MRTLRDIVLLLILIAVGILLATNLKFVSEDVMKIVVIFGFALFFFNIAVRRILWFRPYYISKFNFLTSKFSYKKMYDLTSDILFLKMIEVLQNSRFKVVKYDEKKGLILAISKMTWTSWGENIYVKLEGSGDITVVKFTSATIFGVYSWGKNKENYNTLLSKFDESLII